MNEYKTVGARFIAAIADVIIVIPLTLIGTYFTENNNFSLTTNFLSQVLIQMIYVAYFVLMHFFYGQTLGKMIMSVRIVDLSKNKITFAQSVCRNIPQFIPLLIIISSQNPQVLSGNPGVLDLFFATKVVFLLTIISSVFSIINAVILLLNPKHRALHDYMAGTVVIKTNI